MASRISEMRSVYPLSGGMDGLLEDIFFKVLMKCVGKKKEGK
jgi:hypothetical protein